MIGMSIFVKYWIYVVFCRVWLEDYVWIKGFISKMYVILLILSILGIKILCVVIFG